MTKLLRMFLAPICLIGGLATVAYAAVTPGAMAPDFTLTATDGKSVNLLVD